MNSNELNFAYRVRHALNENLDNLPASTTDRLAAARILALARKKENAPLRAFLSYPALASGMASIFREPSTWLSRMGLVIPLVVLVVGLIGLVEYEEQQQISEIAEIDAAVLADELPLSAYLDHGFNAFLAERGD